MTMYIFLAGFGVMCASLAGVIFVNKTLSGTLERNIKILIAFAVGVFSVLVYTLLTEAIEIGIQFSTFLLAIFAGALFLEIIGRTIHHNHIGHTLANAAHQSGNKINVNARKVLIGDAVHNISDGLILVPAFFINPAVGITTAVSIFIHEFVQEVAEFFVLRASGYSTKEALIRNFLASSTILIGVAIGLFVISVGNFEAFLIAFGAGAFMHVILRDLLPELVDTISHNRGHAAGFILAIVVGAALMIGVERLAPHTHEHGAHEHNSHSAEELHEESEQHDHE